MHVEAHLRKAFATWVVDTDHPETVPAPVGQHGKDPAMDPYDATAGGWSLSALVYRLWDSTDTLPWKVSTALGLPRSATFGHAAQLLWWLRTGERFLCRSYAQAVACLQDLEEATFTELYQSISDYLRDSDRVPRWPASEGASRPLVAH